MNKFVLWVLLLFSVPSVAGEYMSLKYDEVNLRTGPGERFPISWVYQEKNYPVEVLDSFELWRQIREVDGTIGWVHKNMLTQRRHALVRQEKSLLEKPRSDAEAVAILQPGVVALVQECPKGDYCQLKVSYFDKKYEGWFPRASLWGLDLNEVID